MNGKVIALVDDDAAVRNSIQVFLEAFGAAVLTYENGRRFLQANPKLDCLLVDYDMPDMNGIEVISEMRRQGSVLPTIIITAIDDPKLKLRVAGAGIPLVPKSAGPALLLRTIGKLLD